MTTAMSRRTMLKAATATAGAALTGACGFRAQARPVSAVTVQPLDGRVGATVTPNAYPGGATWDQGMASFNADVRRDFEVAKRYFRGANTWPTAGNIGVRIQSLIDRGCRRLLCFKPAIDGSDLTKLLDSLKAIKKAGLTDAKITLYQEQGLGDKLTATQFKQVYDRYQEVSHVFPLFVDFSGSAAQTWAAYRPAKVDGIAVDFYANTWVHYVHKGNKDPLGILGKWADDAGQQLGIWEIGVSASTFLPTPAELRGYFDYLAKLQGDRLNAGHLVGDIAWYNGPHGGYYNTISGLKLSPRCQEARKGLDHLFDLFNVA